MIARLIGLCARRPAMVLLLAGALLAWGIHALLTVPVDAIPDLSDVQVIIFTEWPGQSPDIVEDQVTYPITTTLLAAPQVQFVRGQTFFGLSFVYAIFEDGTDIYWARSRVLEYLDTVKGKLPEGVTPRLGPDATGVGWVYQYALVDRNGGHDLAELRSLQDWYLRYVVEAVPGVAECASVGGFVREYQIQLDPEALFALEIPLSDVIRAVRRSNNDVGGRTLEIAGHEHFIRGRGYVRSIRDLESIPLAVDTAGTPITVSDVGTVSLGPALRRGIAELDGEGEVVGGIVVMRYGENALEVIRNVKEKLADAARSLPEGVEIVTTYDRSELIQRAIGTLRHELLLELLIVSITITLFLLHLRSSLVPIILLPAAVVLSFIPLAGLGITANILSLGGIAIAIGAMVDASIIMVENVHKGLEGWERGGRQGQRLNVVVSALQEVGPSIFFSLLVITVSFLPVFTLTGTEGRLFRPLAYTKTFSMGFAALLAVTLGPALAVLFIRGRTIAEDRHPLSRILIAAYAPVVRFVVRHRWSVIVGSGVILLATLPAFLRLGNEFMPPLNEGTILYMPTALPGMSATEAVRVLQSMDRQLKRFPEVDRVFGKIGRSTTPTDPAPLSMVETVVTFKPEEQWREGMTWDDLLAEMDEALDYPGMPNIWWMPIQTRTEMLATGIRSTLGIKVFGDDLEAIERTAVAIEEAIQEVPGTRSAFAERTMGGYFLDLVIDREAASRHGLTVGDVQDVIAAAVGGVNVGEVVDGRERYPINVRYARDFRDEPEALERVLVPTPRGAQIPLSQVVRMDFVTGPPMIREENGRLVGFVFVDVAGRPIADYVSDAREVVESEVTLASGQTLEWAGQFRHYERARDRLTIIIPVTLLIVFFLLYLNFGSAIETSIVLLAIPFSLVGAVWLLYLLDYNLSVAVWVGAIALAGLDAETGTIMLLYLKLAHRRWNEEGRLKSFADLTEAIVDGAARRVRPKLMTVGTTFIALLPILWSSGTGADMMKRIAAPMVGGLVTSLLLELTVYPAIFAIWKGRALPAVRAPRGPA